MQSSYLGPSQYDIMSDADEPPCSAVAEPGAGSYTPRVKDIFGALTHEQWLAILRIGVGLWWLESVRHKDLRHFLRGSAMNWVESLTANHPIPPFANTIRSLSLSSRRRRVVTSWLVVAGEFCVGASLVLGLLTPVGALVGLFLNLNYLLLAGLKDQGEQGQNLMMILSEVVIFATGAGMTWGLDGLLF
jgi:thiosulfate dehydrogenase [quinone] large subunit